MHLSSKKFTINGPAGRLEAMLMPSAMGSNKAAVVCHPHPLRGGDMHNKVAHFTARALNRMGLPVLRFNFRGVGDSEGEFGQAVGEVEDLQAAAEWLQSRYPGYGLILAGFSFGAYVTAKLAAGVKPAGLISVAPPVNLYDFTALASPGCPWLVIQGGADEVVPPQAVREWAQARQDIDRLVWMDGVGHFFHGELLTLDKAIRGWVENNIRSA